MGVVCLQNLPRINSRISMFWHFVQPIQTIFSSSHFRPKRTYCPVHQVADGKDENEKTGLVTHSGPGKTETTRNSSKTQGKREAAKFNKIKLLSFFFNLIFAVFRSLGMALRRISLTNSTRRRRCRVCSRCHRRRSCQPRLCIRRQRRPQRSAW